MHVDAVFGGIGRFSVRFRWLMTLAWLVATFAAVAFLPALSSVTQSDNTKFLPSSSPMERALVLSAPLGGGNLTPIPLIVARQGASLTPQDLAAVGALQRGLLKVPNVRKVVVSAPTPTTRAGQAIQLSVMVLPASGSGETQIVSLVDALRARISATARPAGLQAHLAGGFPIAADQAKANGNQGKQVQYLSALFIIVLLMVIFRSFTLSLVTLIPAFISVMIAGPLVAEAAQHGVQVSSIAQLLLVVLVLGAGTDYGLFLVFRVREQLRIAEYDGGPADRPAGRGLLAALWGDLRRPREPARIAVVESITRVGESITFSAATVIVAVLTLLVASFSFYADMGIPFAISIGVMLIAALFLLPALLSIRLSLLGVKRTLFQAWFGRPKLIPWSIQGGGKAGLWGGVATRIVRRPVPTLVIGLVFFAALASGLVGYRAAGFGGGTAAPARSDSAAGGALLAKFFPRSSANPTALIFRFAQPVWTNAAELNTITTHLAHSGQFTGITGPLNPVGSGFTPAQFTQLYGALGSPKALPPNPPPGMSKQIPVFAYQLYRATGNFISLDGRTVQYLVGLKAGDPGGTPALNAVPAIRAATTSAANAAGATDSGVAGQAPAFYDISNLSNNDLTKIIPIAILAIGLLLALVLRSLVAPLYLIASVGVSYLAALGLSVIIFVEIGHSGGLMFFMAFLMFIFLLALGEDYNILVMTRIREEAHKLPLREAVSKAISVTGTTVTSAGLVLAGTFVVLAFSGGGGTAGAQVRDMGIGLALGILMDTFLVRTLLVPSTVVLLGRWNWWPSKLTMDAPEHARADGKVPPEPAGTGGGAGHAH